VLATLARAHGFFLQVLFQEGQYVLQLQCHLPEQYPEAALELELQQSNPPPDMVAAFLVSSVSRLTKLTLMAYSLQLC
jgi:hypothetical protein